MFKRHALQVKLVKTNKPDAPEATAAYTPSELEFICKMVTKENVRFAAIAIVSVIGTVILLKTASEIAINASPKK